MSATLLLLLRLALAASAQTGDCDDSALMQLTLHKEVQKRGSETAEEVPAPSSDVNFLLQTGIHDSEPDVSIPKEHPAVSSDINEWAYNVPPGFKATVASWGKTGCRKPDSGRKLESVSSLLQEIANITEVYKHVNVTQPQIRIEEVPVPVNLTQDTVRYVPMTKKVQKRVEVEKVEKRNRMIEVPHYKEVIRNVTKNFTRQVVKNIPKNVTVQVPKVTIQDNPVEVALREEQVTYHNVTQNVKLQVHVPRIHKVRKEVETVQIEEVLHEVDAASDSVSEASAEDAEEVEVVKVRIREVRVPVEILQDKITYKTIKKQVHRKVEVPKLVVKRREVEVPQYRYVVKEIPIIELRQRTVEVIKEVPDIVFVDEEVFLEEERLVEVVAPVRTPVREVTEVPSFTSEVVEIKQPVLNIIPAQTMHVVSASEHTGITQEEINVIEEIEEVEKVVEVFVDRVEVIPVHRTVTREVNKSVVLETVREEIHQVQVVHEVQIVMEELVQEVEEIEVELLDEKLVVKQASSQKNLTRETLNFVPDCKDQQEAVLLVPTPFFFSNTTITTTKGCNCTTPLRQVQKNMTQEVIVQDTIHKETVQQTGVLQPLITKREVEVPVWTIDEETIQIPRTRVEEVVVEVPKVYEIEKVVEVPGHVTEEIIEQEIFAPTYVDHPVTLSKDVPTFVRTLHNVSVAIPALKVDVVEIPQDIYEEEIVEVPRVVKVNRTVIKPSKHANHSTPVSRGVKYKEREVVAVVEIPEPKYVYREVEVPVYEVEEILENVPVETIVEELVEVPKIVEIEQFIKVHRIEYNDTVVEKSIKKQVIQKVPKTVPKYKDKVVSVQSAVLDITQETKIVPVKSQLAISAVQVINLTETLSIPILNLTQTTKSHIVQKNVTVKKRVEKLVPKVVERVFQKHVEVLKEVVVERVVPIYTERLVRRLVEVNVSKVVEKRVQKKLTTQKIKAKHVSKDKVVELLVETANIKNIEKEVVLKGQSAPKTTFKEVPVPVPCGVNVGAAAVEPTTTAAPIVVAPEPPPLPILPPKQLDLS